MEWVEEDGTEFVESVLYVVEVMGERDYDYGWVLATETEDWHEAVTEARRIAAEEGRAVRIRHLERAETICDLYIVAESYA